MRTAISGDRPQDGGRSRKRKGAPSSETMSLLEDYQAAMRAELRAALTELQPTTPDAGLGLVKDEPKRPPLAERMKLWDLAIKLGRELGTEIDATPHLPAVVGPSGRRRRADFG